MSFFLFFFTLLATDSAQAKTFSNSYISFELPDTWNCVLEQTEWVCRSQESHESKEAIIILTAKEIGPPDSLEKYMEHLGTPISVTSKKGERFESLVRIKPFLQPYQGQKWIDSLHYQSEIQDYFTRYLATVKEKVAVLVTFSSHKNFYSKYSQVFNSVVKSVQVKSTASIMKNLGGLGAGGTSSVLGPGGNSGVLNLGVEPPTPSKIGSPMSSKGIWIGLAILVLALLYLFKKKKRKK